MADARGVTPLLLCLTHDSVWVSSLFVSIWRWKQLRSLRRTERHVCIKDVEWGVQWKHSFPDRSNFPWLIKYSNPPADLRASLAVNTKDGHRYTLLVPRASHFSCMEQINTSKGHVWKSPYGWDKGTLTLISLLCHLVSDPLNVKSLVLAHTQCMRLASSLVSYSGISCKESEGCFQTVILC